MSCEIQLTATFEGIDKFLQQSNSVSGENEREAYRNQFQDYKIAISPTGEIIVFAKSSWLLICEAKWNSAATEGVKIKYSTNWHGHLPCKSGEKITSVLCLPFFSYGQTIQGGADWTCIVVGFSSGCIRFYTEGMQELACNILHEEPVVEIKCYSPSLKQQGKTLKQDNHDICVLYKSVICIFNGSNLSQTLLSKRSQVAKGLGQGQGEGADYTPVDFKKYMFVGQEAVTDACYVGQTLLSTYTTFDHLVTASCVGGFNSNYRQSPPQTSLIVTSGKRPFVGYHYTLESGSGAMLTDVALAVANKIKSSITANLHDWLGFGGKKASSGDSKPKEVSNEYAEQLNCRFGLCDIWRQGESIILSPDGTFSAVADSLGRVILVNNTTGVAHKLWKGYRNAQCGFMLVKESVQGTRRGKDRTSSSSSSRLPPRQGLFILIYAPKKGLIEVFTTQTGRRVASFKVSKPGRLIYNPRGCLAPSPSAGFTLTHNQVVFISEEGLMEFLVPFHCALADENSKMSRDLHVLKKLKLLLKTEWNTPKFAEEVCKCAGEFKIDEVRYQALNLLINSRNITLEAIKGALTIFLESFRRADKSEPGVKKMVAYAEMAHNLIAFYEFLNGLNSKARTSGETSAPQLEEPLYEVLRTSQTELDIFLEFIHKINEVRGSQVPTRTRVTFEESRSSDLGKFLSRFDFETFLADLDRHEKCDRNAETRSCRLNLKASPSGDVKSARVSRQLFEGLLGAGGPKVADLNEWSMRAESCCLNPSDLAVSLLSFWCERDECEEASAREVGNLIEILKNICSLNEPNIVCVEYNVESPWWLQLRSYIASSPSTIRGLFAALACRSVTIFVEQDREFTCKKGSKKQKSAEGTSFSAEWETISKDTCQWDILITQLQDVALLNAILSVVPSRVDPDRVLPEIPFEFECQCLRAIQLKGTGRVSELVAKWLAQFGLDPSVYVCKTDIEFQGSVTSDAGDDDGEANGKAHLVHELGRANVARNADESVVRPLDYLTLLKTRFPYSLTTSSLLSNLCWEYTAYWSRNVEDLAYLEAALRCLEIVPAIQIGYGICLLSWNTYLQPKLETLAKMVNRMGKVPKLCVQEIGLRNDQVPAFLKLVREYLSMTLRTEKDENLAFRMNREDVWQNGVTATDSSLITIALSQSGVNADAVMLLVQLTICLHLISGLNVKQSKLFSNLFENVDPSNFVLTKSSSSSSALPSSRTLNEARSQFLSRAVAAAVQTIELVEFIHHPTGGDGDTDLDVVPTTRHNVTEYKAWLEMCHDLANIWDLSPDDLRRKQVTELYANGFDRLAEEVISSVNNKQMLGEQLLGILGKRLKYLIEDSKNASYYMANLCSSVNEWLYSVDLKDFKPENCSTEDMEVLARYIVQLVPEAGRTEGIALSILESLAFLKSAKSDGLCDT